MQKFIPCRTCKDGPRPGFLYVERNGVKFAKECSCHIEYNKERLLKVKAKQGNVWIEEKALVYNWNSYSGSKSLASVNKLKLYVDNFDKIIPSIVYMYGPSWCQKTTLAQHVGLNMIRKGKSVIYLEMSSLMKDISNFESDNLVLESYKKCDLLIIDDAFNKEKNIMYKSGYQLPNLFLFFKERMDVYRKNTLIVSDILPSEIKDNGFGESIENFIRKNTEMRKTVLTFEDNYFSTSKDYNLEGLFETL